MKTLTEFSGVVLRQAAAVRDAKSSEGVEADALAEAASAELGLSGDRVARLFEALEAAGGKLETVRTVRVYQGEEVPPRAKSVGEFHYVIERLGNAVPGKADRDDRGRGGRKGGPGGRKPGGPGRGPGGPGGKPGGFGGGKPGGPGGRGTGGFSSDDRPKRGEKVPSGGEGWSLTAAPREGGEGRGRGRGKPPPRRRPPGRPDTRRDNRGGDNRGGDNRGGDNRGARPQRPGPARQSRTPPMPQVDIRPAPLRPEGAPEPAAKPTPPRPPRPRSKPRRDPQPTPTVAAPEAPLPQAATPDGMVQRRKRRSRPRRGGGRGPAAAGGENIVAKPRPEADGNLAPPSQEVDGNAVPPPPIADDEFGNR